MAETTNTCDACNEMPHPGILFGAGLWKDTEPDTPGLWRVERCDACERYPSDRSAAHVLADLEGMRYVAIPDFSMGPPSVFAGVAHLDWAPPADWPEDWEKLDADKLRRRTPDGRALIATPAHMGDRCPDCHVYLRAPTIETRVTSLGRVYLNHSRRCDHCDRTWDCKFLPSTIRAVDCDGPR